MEIKDGKLIVQKDELVKILSKELACNASLYDERCQYGKNKYGNLNFENCIAYQLISLFNPDLKAEGKERKELTDMVIKKNPSQEEVYDFCPICRNIHIFGAKEYSIEQMFSKLKIEILES